MDDPKARCAAVIAKVLEIDASVIDVDASPETIDAWDSLAHVQIVLALEKEFGITIPPDQAVALESFKMVLEAVQEKLQTKEP